MFFESGIRDFYVKNVSFRIPGFQIPLAKKRILWSHASHLYIILRVVVSPLGRLLRRLFSFFP